MKKFFIAVISLTIFTIAGYGIAYIVTPVNSVPLNEYTHTVSYDCDDAYIVRDETVYYSTSNGIVYNIVSDGDRVSENSAISTTYNGDVSNDVLRSLKTVDKKINKLKTENSTNSMYRTDSGATENEIASKMDKVISLARTDSIEEIHSIREDINSLRTGTSVDIQDKIAALRTERAAIESKISAAKTDTSADRAGIFSSYVDGLESVLTPERVREYTPEYIRSLTVSPNEYINGSPIVTGDAICKVMNNHNWYIMGIIDRDHRLQLEAKSNVTVRFSNLSGSSVEGERVYLSEPDENGDSIFLLKIQTYLESAFSFRNIDSEIIFDEYSGYKIPTDALHTGDSIGEYYVYARKGSGTYKCDVKILYSDITDGYSIIASADGAENNLSAMDRLIVGER